VKQRTQAANMLRQLLAEFGLIIPKGVQNVLQLSKRIIDAKTDQLHGKCG
jgi:transposase